MRVGARAALCAGLREISGSHSGAAEESSLLGSYAVYWRVGPNSIVIILSDNYLLRFPVE
jgi:hypothetical protein